MKIKMNGIVLFGIALALCVAGTLIRPEATTAASETSAPAGQPNAAPPASRRVTMIDLGADQCVPCKMMAPIIEELKKEYAGRADIIFYDVWKDPAPARKYNIRAIPTQIFFDHDGQEVYRHTGFLDKPSIVAILKKLGV